MVFVGAPLACVRHSLGNYVSSNLSGKEKRKKIHPNWYKLQFILDGILCVKIDNESQKYEFKMAIEKLCRSQKLGTEQRYPSRRLLQVRARINLSCSETLQVFRVP